MSAAGILYDRSDHTWVVPVRLLPVVVVECDEDEAGILEALVEVQAMLEAIGYTYIHFVVSASHVAIVGLTNRSSSGPGHL